MASYYDLLRVITSYDELGTYLVYIYIGVIHRCSLFYMIRKALHLQDGPTISTEPAQA